MKYKHHLEEKCYSPTACFNVYNKKIESSNDSNILQLSEKL